MVKMATNISSDFNAVIRCIKFTCWKVTVNTLKLNLFSFLLLANQAMQLIQVCEIKSFSFVASVVSNSPFAKWG